MHTYVHTTLLHTIVHKYILKNMLTYIIIPRHMFCTELRHKPYVSLDSSLASFREHVFKTCFNSKRSPSLRTSSNSQVSGSFQTPSMQTTPQWLDPLEWALFGTAIFPRDHSDSFLAY